jgi:3-dehydroquinate dehydratase-2
MADERVLVINGPNLNLLGHREPAVYGQVTLAAISDRLHSLAVELDCSVEARQTNHEGMIVDWIQDAVENFHGIVLNPGALTHYAYAIRDAVAAIDIPTVEVHISNVHARETFRHVSVISPIVTGVVIGFGALGYELALRGLIQQLR